MSSGIWFWIIYVISILFGGYLGWPFDRKSGIWIILFVLVGLLGYRVFGAPVQ
jgi:hypothetical protein